MTFLSLSILYPFQENYEGPSKRKEGKPMIQASIREVFEDLGCIPCTAKAMLEDQGIYTFDDLCLLKDWDVEALCKNVKCPGGAAGGGGGGTGEPTSDTMSVERLR